MYRIQRFPKGGTVSQSFTNRAQFVVLICAIAVTLAVLIAHTAPTAVWRGDCRGLSPGGATSASVRAELTSYGSADAGCAGLGSPIGYRLP